MPQTFIRGVPGIIAAVNARREAADAAVQRLIFEREGRFTDVRSHAEIHARGELAALTELWRYLNSSTVLTEDEHDNRFKIGGAGSPGEAAYAVTLS